MFVVLVLGEEEPAATAVGDGLIDLRVPRRRELWNRPVGADADPRTRLPADQREVAADEHLRRCGRHGVDAAVGDPAARRVVSVDGRRRRGEGERDDGCCGEDLHDPTVECASHSALTRRYASGAGAGASTSSPNSPAAARARSSRSRSRRMCAKRRSLSPCWRVPSSSPSPRRSRSTSASSKPSVVATSASSRCCAVSVSSSLRARDEQAVRLLRAAADAAAQLVQLGEAEAVGVLDDHHRRVRDVDADLDHRRRDEHVELARLERAPSRRGAASGLQPAVQAADAEPAQLGAPQPLGLGLRRARERRLGLLDQRADDVGLPALARAGRVSRVYASDARSSAIQRVTIGLRARAASRSPTRRGRRRPSARACAGSASRS